MIEKIYLKLTDKEKQRNKTVRLYTVVLAVCFVSFLVCTVYIYRYSLSNFIVIDKTANHLPYEITSRKDVMQKHIKQHCIFSSHYLNSFDRATLKSNQAKALFYIDKNSAYRVFDTYITNKSYSEVLNNGFIYKNEFVEIQELNISEKPFFVTFLSKTIINNGFKDIGEINIQTKGIVSIINPTEDNLIGWYLSELKQEYKRLDYEY